MKWRHIKMVEVRPGRFALVTEYLGNPFGPLARKAMHLDPRINTNDLATEEAFKLGERIDRWIQTQNDR
jgi:hypothetical protein